MSGALVGEHSQGAVAVMSNVRGRSIISGSKDLIVNVNGSA